LSCKALEGSRSHEGGRRLVPVARKPSARDNTDGQR